MTCDMLSPDIGFSGVRTLTNPVFRVSNVSRYYDGESLSRCCSPRDKTVAFLCVSVCNMWFMLLASSTLSWSTKQYKSFISRVKVSSRFSQNMLFLSDLQVYCWFWPVGYSYHLPLIVVLFK